MVIVALVGSGDTTASLIRVLSEFENVELGALVTEDIAGPAATLAIECKVPIVTSREAAGADIAVYIETTANGAGSETIGPASALLLYRLIEESRTHFEEANRKLEKNLAEIFFVHEFFKALTSYRASVEDVVSLIADGAGGILGTEVAAVYMIEDERLRLVGAQGLPRDAFYETVPVGSGVAGSAAEKRELVLVQAGEGGAKPESFLVDNDALRTLAAVPLVVQDKLLGVLAVGQGQPRDFTKRETARIHSIGHMSSMALQNAVFHQELERLSITDRLTELYNHGYFQQRLEEELSLARRHGNELALLLFDIDYFKRFNDRFGHPKGDLVLKAVGRVVKSVARFEDAVARYGGEEFVIVAPNTGKESAAALAERIRSAIESEVFEGDEEEPEVTKTVSIGVATFPGDAETQAELIEAADQALYRAKDSGRNRVVTA